MCRFNNGVLCISKKTCDQCGWNPTVAGQRMREIRRLPEADAQRVRPEQPAHSARCGCDTGVQIFPDGVHRLDPCIYAETERYANVTVSVMRCRNCGHTELSWFRQNNTEELEIE